MSPIDVSQGSDHGLPEMLTLPEAARALRIGRTLAYQLATQYLAGEPGGLPVIRLGGGLRVPRSALEDLAHGHHVVSRADLTAAVAEAVDRLLSPSVSDIAPRPTRPNRRRRPTRDAPQLSLLDGN